MLLKGYLLDENLPTRLRFTIDLPVLHSRDLDKSLNDETLWDYAKQEQLAIISKDTDFLHRMLMSEPPPKVVHLRFGNMRF